MVYNILQKFLKGDECERKIYNQLLKYLKKINKNLQIIPKYYAPTGEIDILVIDPILGILVLDVKNWKYFASENELKRAFNTLKRHNDAILEKLKEKFSYIPINTDFKLVFCQKPPKKLLKSKWVNTMIQNKKIVIADENGDFVKDLFEVNYNLKEDIVIDTKDKFQEILEVLAITDLQNIKERKKELHNRENSSEDEFGRIYITPYGILHLDAKFSSILSSYRKGLRIIRGLAGTGKTIVLVNLVLRNPKKRFLFLCFNRRLKDSLEELFKDVEARNIIILSLFELLYKLDPVLKKYQQLDKKWNYIRNNKENIKIRLNKFLKENQIDVIIVDEAQDFAPEVLRSIFELNSNLVIGIDEGQNIYDYGISDIKEEVFKDVNLQGKVTNLRTIYRTPENIAKTAIQILALDETLHPYYRSEYLERKKRIKYLLPGGRIYKFLRKKEILYSIIDYLNKNKEDYMVLIPSKKFLKKFDEKLGLSKLPAEKIATIDSVKGLESDNVIILGFNEYLIQNIKYNLNKIYRRLYTLLTRAKKRVFIDLYWEYFNEILTEFLKKEIKDNNPNFIYNKIRSVYLILEKESIRWSEDNEVKDLEGEDFNNMITSLLTIKGSIIKTSFEKLAPLIEFLANVKGLIT